MKKNKTMKRLFLIILLFGLFFQNIYAQQPFCADAEPFCTGTVYNYPLATGTSSETGPDYGCLLTQPNPVWYFLQISVAGDINIHMESTPGSYDIDFICWGPFTTATGACTAGLTAGNTVDCSYSTASVEDCYIPNAQVGEFYMFLLTNYSNSTTDVEFSSGTSTGETDCSIVVPCTMTNITVNVGLCDPATNTYDITGTIVYIDPPATGSLIIEDDAGFSDSFLPTPNFFSPTNFSITGIPADGLTHTLYAYFTDDGCNYTITYTAPVSCTCVTPPGTITVSTPDCHDSPVTFTYVPGTVDPGATYAWNFGAGATPATANTVGPHVVTYSTPGTTPNISLTVTDPGVCAPDVINTSVTIPTEITVTNSSSTPEVCGALDGAISVTAAGGTGALSYNIGSGGQATGNFTNLPAGPYTITITDANGCTITELVTVGTSGTVTSGFTASADQCLTGNSFDFTNTGDTGGGITWTWSFPGGTPAFSANENPTGITWTIPGQYDVTQTTHLGGCNTTTTITIEVFAEPIPTLSSTNVTCNGACDGTASVDLVYTDYSWDNGANTQLITNLCDGQYCVTVTDVNGCTGTACVTIIQTSGITINSETASDVTCFGDNDGSVVVSATGGTPPLTYTDGTSSNQTGSFLGLGGGTYIVTITDGNGCTTTSSALVVIEPAAIVIDSQSSTDVSCYGYNDGSITVTASGGAGGLTYSIDGNQQSAGDFTNLSANIYTVTVTDINACTNTAGFTITEPAEIIISITSGQIVCNGQTANINVTIVGGNQPYTYHWSHDASINSSSIFVAPTTETVYSVYVMDANGCATSTVTSTVSVSPPVQLDLNTQNDSVCPGEPAVITITPSSGIGPPYLTYVNGNVQDSPFTVYPSEATTYIVTAMDACGSVATESITINVYELPPISFAPNISSGCQPLEVHFVETSPDEGQTFVWNFGDIDNNNLAYDKSPVHTYDDPGIYDVTLTVTSVDGCVNTDTKLNLITVYPQPIAKFIADPEVVSIIKPMINFINHSSLNDINFWFFGDGDSSSAENPCHIYPTYPTGTYNVELIVSTIHGCKDTTFIIVQVQNEYTFYAPTAFSPDFDGINDYFIVKGNGIDKRNFHLIIYDRWGEVIFETNDIDEGWDGRVKGGDIGKNATYTWLAIYKDLRSVEHQEAGAVTIIR